MKKLTIIVSCFNEEESIPLFYKEINKVKELMKSLEFELLFVNDGSTDKTLEIIKDLSKKDKNVKYISFSRNFGKEAAMYEGLKNASGDYITLMDADLQDPPSMLKEMYEIIETKEYDMVATRRVNRIGEPPIRSFFARCFYKIINKMSKIEMVDGARDYRLMTKEVKDAICELKEYNRYSKGLFSFVGFNTKWLEYENVKRVAGETKWSFWKLFKYAIEGIVAFTTVPLTLSALLGLIMCIVSFFAILFIFVRTILFGDPVSGWPSTICIILFVSGVQLLSMGIMGEYLAKTYLETKNRPIYIVKETNIK